MRMCIEPECGNLALERQGRTGRPPKPHCEEHRRQRYRHNKQESFVRNGGLLPKFGPHRRKGREPSHRPEQRYLYYTWAGMVQRCTNPANKHYADYGGRGITVYGSWRDNPKVFIDWIEANLGPRPANPDGWISRTSYWSLDRIDNDKGYEPGNLRWATPAVQTANRRSRKGTL